MDSLLHAYCIIHSASHMIRFQASAVGRHDGMHCVYYFGLDRLEAYERNANFGNVLDSGAGPVFHMDLPDLESYKDVNTDMQVIPCLIVIRFSCCAN